MAVRPSPPSTALEAHRPGAARAVGAVDLSVVVPVLDEEGNVDRLYERLTRSLDGLGRSL